MRYCEFLAERVDFHIQTIFESRTLSSSDHEFCYTLYIHSFKAILTKYCSNFLISSMKCQYQGNSGFILKYFRWKANITEILTLHQKYFRWNANISEILTLYQKYFYSQYFYGNGIYIVIISNVHQYFYDIGISLEIFSKKD